MNVNVNTILNLEYYLSLIYSFNDLLMLYVIMLFYISLGLLVLVLVLILGIPF
jgi:hypothetical protein